MCELRPFKCTVCGVKWLAQKRLASCENGEEGVKCPEELCMYVGNPRRPQGGVCGGCRRMRRVGQRWVEGQGS